jgi:hypothetical protein
VFIASEVNCELEEVKRSNKYKKKKEDIVIITEDKNTTIKN